MKTSIPIVLLIGSMSLTLACGSEETSTNKSAVLVSPEITFEEVTDDRVPNVVHDSSVEPNDFFGPAVAVGDINNDGRDDLYIAQAGLFLNTEDSNGFRLQKVEFPETDVIALGAFFGDVDRDGDLDLVLGGYGGIRLFLNDGHGSFSDHTDKAGLSGFPDEISVAVTLGDINADGFLDIAVGNYGLKPDVDASGVHFKENDGQQGHLFLNQRDGTFIEPTNSPVQQHDYLSRTMVAVFADFDFDGLVDVYYADDSGIPLSDKTERRDLVFLYKGIDDLGNPLLEESSEKLGLSIARSTMGCAFGDGGENGWDLFFTDIDAGWYFHGEQGQPRFDEQGRERKIDLSGPDEERWVQWGSIFRDLNGDGLEDLMIAQSSIHSDEEEAPRQGPLLLKNKGESFELERYLLGKPARARAMPLVDLNLDGNPDAITAPYYDKFHFFLNKTARANYIRLKLQASVSAPGAAGAIVSAISQNHSQRRMLVAGGQPGSSGEGIIDLVAVNNEPNDITITWPSGAIQKTEAVGAGTIQTMVEPKWLSISDTKPSADGDTKVQVIVDCVAAGLLSKEEETQVSWTDDQGELTVDTKNGVATLVLAARSEKISVRALLKVNGKALPIRPAIDYVP